MSLTVDSLKGPIKKRLPQGGLMMSKSTSFLYQLARTANDIEKLASGDPKRIARRAKNKYLGRKLIRKAWKFPF